MPLTVLIVPDKFKGTLTAAAAGSAIARGWLAARKRDRVRHLSMTDGGDGFGEVMSRLLRARAQRVHTVDAARHPCTSSWWWVPRTKTAIVESAQTIGLAMLPPGKFHPVNLDTFGLGAVFEAVWEKGARRCLVGVGGSATNDGGFGLARALGWKFLDGRGTPIERWTNLVVLDRIQPPRQRRRIREIVVAVDVQNPLLGARGATRVYGPQKGLRASDLGIAERCLCRLAAVFERQYGRDPAVVPGAGAAGGLGFGLRAFVGARIRPGFELFARAAELRRLLRSADIVITGEGRMDRSTLMGKGAGEVARSCRRSNIPCIALCGTIEDPVRLKAVFARVHALTDLTTREQAGARAGYWLERLARQTAAAWLPRRGAS